MYCDSPVSASSASDLENSISTITGVVRCEVTIFPVEGDQAKKVQNKSMIGLVELRFDPDMVGIREIVGVIQRFEEGRLSAHLSVPTVSHDKGEDLEKQKSLLKKWYRFPSQYFLFFSIFSFVAFFVSMALMIMHHSSKSAMEILDSRVIWNISLFDVVMWGISTPIQV